MRLAAGAICVLALGWPLSAQRGGGARGGGAPRRRVTRRRSTPPATGCRSSPKTGSGGWSRRRKGSSTALPLSAEGRRDRRRVGSGEGRSAGEQCRAYGAAGIMRLPTRLHITWQDANTLKVETDYGTQTRLFHFDAAPAPSEPSWQGHSVAQWESPAAPAPEAALRAATSRCQTTHLRPGYVRKNGAPYSDKTVVTEYFDLNTAPNGDQLADGNHESRRHPVLPRPVHHDVRFQEASRRQGLESHSLLGALSATGRESHSHLSLPHEPRMQRRSGHPLGSPPITAPEHAVRAAGSRSTPAP